MIKWLEIKNTFRNKRFILFTLLLPSFWYLFMLGFSDSFKLHGQEIKYILYLTAVLIGISGNSIVTFSKKISTTRSFYQLQRLTSHYSFNHWLIDQLVVQIMLNTIICIVLIVLGEIYQAIPFTFTFLVLLLLVLILGIYLSIIGFWIGIRLDSATISALSMPLSTGFSLLMFPWSGYISGNNWFLKVTFFIQKFFPGYYISEQLERMQNNQNTLTTVLLFILTNMAIFVPTVFLLKKIKKIN